MTGLEVLKVATGLLQIATFLFVCFVVVSEWLKDRRERKEAAKTLSEWRAQSSKSKYIPAMRQK